MANAGKKFLYITFENPASLRIVVADLVGKCPELIDGFMGAFSISAGKRVCNECFIKEGVQYPVNCVVQEPISNTCFMDVSWLWVVNLERVVFAVFVGLILQIVMQRQNIIHEVELEFLYIFLVPFALNELLPGQKQVINTN